VKQLSLAYVMPIARPAQYRSRGQAAMAAIVALAEPLARGELKRAAEAAKIDPTLLCNARTIRTYRPDLTQAVIDGSVAFDAAHRSASVLAAVARADRRADGRAAIRRDPPAPRQRFAEGLRELRLAHGRQLGSQHLSARRFAAMLGIAASRYTRYERAEIEPPLMVLMRLRRVTGGSLDRLIDECLRDTTDAAQVGVHADDSMPSPQKSR
jgi:hypothetical protein